LVIPLRSSKPVGIPVFSSCSRIETKRLISSLEMVLSKSARITCPILKLNIEFRKLFHRKSLKTYRLAAID
jgi:hypothetical protein